MDDVILSEAKDLGGRPATGVAPRFFAALRMTLLLFVAGCGATQSQPSDGSLQVYAISATDTPQPTPVATATLVPSPTKMPPSPTPTLGPLAYTLDFATERRDDVTLHVGQVVELRLTTGPASDWLSGVDDARVLRPMSPDGNGVYQAMIPGTALLTAHVPQGCANLIPGARCKNPEVGLWYQTRVYVIA
jgi:hypothetical protein